MDNSKCSTVKKLKFTNGEGEGQVPVEKLVGVNQVQKERSRATALVKNRVAESSKANIDAPQVIVVSKHLGDGIQVEVGNEELDYYDDEQLEHEVEEEFSDKDSSDSEVSVKIKQVSQREKEEIEEAEYEKLMEEPGFLKVFDRLFDKRMKRLSGPPEKEIEYAEVRPGQGVADKGRMQAEPQTVKGMQQQENTNLSPNNRVNGKLIKSPSDTTIYVPALRKRTAENAMVDKISNFVE